MCVAVLHERLGNFGPGAIRRALPPGSELIFTRPSEMFAFYFNVALIGGVMLAAPFVSYQVWRLCRRACISVRSNWSCRS